MFSLLKNKKHNLVIGILVILCGVSKKTYALLCTSNNNIRQDIILNKKINVTANSSKPGTLLWCSDNYTTKLQCINNRKIIFTTYSGLPAYSYWNPQGSLAQIHNSIEVSVRYSGTEINPIGGRNEAGKGTGMIDTPLLIKVNYTVCIKSTGRMPPESGRINDNNVYAIFQVDDQYYPLSTNTFNVYLSGLSNIQFSCVPRIKVIANNNSVVNFGIISKQKAVVGKIEKRIPFSIVANIDGQDCQGSRLQAIFKPNSPFLNNNLILPIQNNGMGIFISNESTPNIPIFFNKPIYLNLSNTSNIDKRFFANLKWLDKEIKPGPFNTSANIDLIFN